MTGTNQGGIVAPQSILVERDFEAPRELVFKAWTDPAHLRQWWGPKGFATPYCAVDLRPGGSFHYCMRSPDDHEFWGLGVYRETVAPERLVYVDSFADKDGNPVAPTEYGMSESHPFETLVTVTFADYDGKTRVTVRHELEQAAQDERDGTRQGWTEMLERLAGHLSEI